METYRIMVGNSKEWGNRLFRYYLENYYSVKDNDGHAFLKLHFKDTQWLQN